MLPTRAIKISLIIIVMLATAGIASALAAANTVPPTSAGDGSGVISGYTVSNIDYNLNAANPANIDSVEFDLNATAGTVTIKLVAAGSTWYSCTNAVNHWTCTTTGATVLSADELRVVATD
jgi:hypothetical protein